MFFEWDETKRQANLAKHLIDFAVDVGEQEVPLLGDHLIRFRAKCGLNDAKFDADFLHVADDFRAVDSRFGRSF